jgi:hypothetical protein
MGNTNSGFTVIETTLFLAISAALVLVTILGTGSLITSIRFSDGMRSTHSFIQSQYDEILNGVNPREAARICGAATEVEPGTSGCLLLGKLINFQIGTGSLKTYYVVSTDIPDLADPAVADASDTELIAAVNPVVVNGEGSAEEFVVPWGARVFASKRLQDDVQVNTYVLLRSPRSSRLVSYTFNLDRMALEGTGTVALATQVSQPANIQRPTNFCIESIDAPDPPAAITVADGQGQNAIALTFDIDDVTGKCDGN